MLGQARTRIREFEAFVRKATGIQRTIPYDRPASRLRILLLSRMCIFPFLPACHPVLKTRNIKVRKLVQVPSSNKIAIIYISVGI